jgi:phosphoglycerate dehydrogenase-like enzyme
MHESGRRRRDPRREARGSGRPAALPVVVGDGQDRQPDRQDQAEDQDGHPTGVRRARRRTDVVCHGPNLSWPSTRAGVGPAVACSLRVQPSCIAKVRRVIPRVAIGPRPASFAARAVADGGGSVVDHTDDPDALVWLDAHDPGGLSDVLAATPSIRWVQLPMAGVERVADRGLFDGDHRWTSAKGAYAEPVAEHALALTLAGLRHLHERVVARSWGAPAGTSLYGERVTILGGGGITEALLGLLAPFRVEATVVRRRAEPVPGATSTVPPAALHDVLPGSLAVVLALALTPDTRGIIGAPELELMDERAWLVNVARGPHVDTDALVGALTGGSIAGAALDVTDPEPLPDGHPLWDRPNCIITPHTADTIEMVLPLLAERIRVNVERFAAGLDLVGMVDPASGY